MSERVLVKHAVSGRMLLDTSKVEGVTYTVSREEVGRAVVELRGVTAGVAAAIIRFKEELNLFLFEEPEQGDATKHWFYVNSGENTRYDETNGVLTISAAGEITYNPKDYWE